MSFDAEKRIADATDQFKELCRYVVEEGQGNDAYAVEKHLFRESFKMLLDLMAAYFDTKQGGDVGTGIETEQGDYLPRERLKPKRFVCVFGELQLQRYYYHEDNVGSVFPLDQETNLPQRCYSYVVQEFLQRHDCRMTYDEAIKEMTDLFGFAPYKHTIEDMAGEAAQDEQAYYDSHPAPDPDSEGDILVCAMDGKGVPQVKGQPAESKVRLARGEKRSRKKEATVAAVYTIDPYVRTVDDIVGEIVDKQAQPPRPRPQTKHVRATLSGKDNGFAWAVDEMERRDPDKTKQRICLMDGSPGLWTVALNKLDGCTFILDIFHVLEYLWKAAYVFHPESSPDAEAFVRKRLKMLLEGRVGYVIGGLRQMLAKHKLPKAKRRILQTTINYYAARKQWMRYDEYIAAGYPIGSGAVEAACRHLVKDRMEGSGMRWTIPGAEAILQLRAMYLNDEWDAYWQFHMEQERQRRFGAITWRILPPQQEAA